MSTQFQQTTHGGSDPETRYIENADDKREEVLVKLMETRLAWKRFVASSGGNTKATALCFYVDEIKSLRDQCGSYIGATACHISWCSDRQAAANVPHMTLEPRKTALSDISSSLDELVRTGKKLKINDAIYTMRDTMDWMKKVNTVLLNMEYSVEATYASRIEAEGKLNWFKDLYPGYIEGALKELNGHISSMDFPRQR